MDHEEVFRTGNIGGEPSPDYLKSLDVLDNVVRDCIFVSRKYGGIQAPTSKHFYASLVFTALLTRGVSLVCLAPFSKWANKMIEHWDYASATTIVRTMLELRGAFHYLCIDDSTDDEWACRWNLLNLHDCNSRKRLLEAFGKEPDQVALLERQAEEIRDRLKQNSFFVRLDNQKRLLNGQTAYLYPIEDMLEKAGIEKKTYRGLHILFSTHVHGLPMSYYRIGEQERGRGIPSPVEEGYTSLCHSLGAARCWQQREMKCKTSLRALVAINLRRENVLWIDSACQTSIGAPKRA